MEEKKEYSTEELEVFRNFVSYSYILDMILKTDPKIKLESIGPHTVNFEKNGKTFGHAIGTWQCAADPTRPGITEEQVADWVITSMKHY